MVSNYQSKYLYWLKFALPNEFKNSVLWSMPALSNHHTALAVVSRLCAFRPLTCETGALHQNAQGL